MKNTSTPIIELIQERFEGLTRAERQLANSLMDDYPVSGLSSITSIAHHAHVSTTTVARMIQKIGFNSFPQFQKALRNEVKAQASNPIDKHESWSKNVPQSHALNTFTDVVIQNVYQTLNQIDPHVFDATCQLFANQAFKLNIVGGRITRSLAEYLHTHMQMIRPNVTLLPSNANAWTHYLLDMGKDDILIIFDIRRYENDLLRLARMATNKKMSVVLFTDQWGSPVSKVATYRFNCRIEVPSAWDSSVASMLLLETMISVVQNQHWSKTKQRLSTLEKLFDQTTLFRKF